MRRSHKWIRTACDLLGFFLPVQLDSLETHPSGPECPELVPPRCWLAIRSLGVPRFAGPSGPLPAVSDCELSRYEHARAGFRVNVRFHFFGTNAPQCRVRRRARVSFREMPPRWCWEGPSHPTCPPAPDDRPGPPRPRRHSESSVIRIFTKSSRPHRHTAVSHRASNWHFPDDVATFPRDSR